MSKLIKLGYELKTAKQIYIEPSHMMITLDGPICMEYLGKEKEIQT